MSIIHGQKGREIYTDVKSGSRIFLLVTTDSLPPKSYQETRVCKDPKTGQDIRQTVIKCSLLKVGSPNIPDDTPLRVSGHFDTNVKAKYAWQFIVDDVKEECTDGWMAEKYLLSPQFKGFFSSSDARNVRDYVEQQNADLFKILLSKGGKQILKDLTSASEININQTIEKIKRLYSERKVYNKLHPLGFTYTDCVRLIKLYGSEADRMLMEDPYRVGQKIGADFKLRDEINRSLGKGPASAERFFALGAESARLQEEKGHTMFSQDDLFNSVEDAVIKSVYHDDSFPVSEVIPFANDELVYFETEEGPMAAGRKTYDAERGIVEEVLRIVHSASPQSEPFEPELIDYAANLSKVSYGTQQKEAFATMLSHRGFKILTGGPGTGKTTTINGILAAYEKMHPDHRIKLCAPTGRAAQRMSESTGRVALTIHRLLDTRPDGNNELAYQVGSDPIEADLVVVDETSMLDVELCYNFLKNIKNNTTVIFVGDINQLESVGPGSVLKDLLAAPADIVERCMLTEIFRQGSDSPIIVNAQKIQDGNSDMMQTPDFQVITTDAQGALEMTKKIINSYYDPEDPFRTQILCPVKKGIAGITSMNNTFQEILNGQSKAKISYGSTVFKKHDKIIMTQNNYEMGYFNGDIGMIAAVKDQALIVEIRNEYYKIEKDMIEHVDLAYALTVHKSQGSEFENVIIVLPKDQPGMLTRNLIYTAVTRAKKKVWIIEEAGALQQACLTDNSGYRKTMLGHYMEWMSEGKSNEKSNIIAVA